MDPNYILIHPAQHLLRTLRSITADGRRRVSLRFPFHFFFFLSETWLCLLTNPPPPSTRCIACSNRLVFCRDSLPLWEVGDFEKALECSYSGLSRLPGQLEAAATRRNRRVGRSRLAENLGTCIVSCRLSVTTAPSSCGQVAFSAWLDPQRQASTKGVSPCDWVCVVALGKLGFFGNRYHLGVAFLGSYPSPPQLRVSGMSYI